MTTAVSAAPPAAPANAFAPAFLARLGPGEEGALAGASRRRAWTVSRLAPARYSVEAPGRRPRPAVCLSRDLALVLAAVLPTLAGRDRYELAAAPEDGGYVLRRAAGRGRGQVVGRLPHFLDALRRPFTLAEELAASPARLAQLLEAAGGEVLCRAVQLLAAADQAAVPAEAPEWGAEGSAAVFAPSFLDRFTQLDQPATSGEACHAGPWQVLPAGGGYGAVQLGDDEPAAVFTHRTHALLAAAIFPGLGRDESYVLGEPRGIAGREAPVAPLREAGDPLTLAWLEDLDPAVLDLLHAADALLRSPASLALLLEAAGGRRLGRAGQRLAAAVAERRRRRSGENLAELLAAPFDTPAGVAPAFAAVRDPAPRRSANGGRGG